MHTKTRLLAGALLAVLLTAALRPLSAAVTVDAGTVVRQIPAGIGGTGIQAHDNHFATNRDGIPYQSDLGLAGVGLVRTVTYPDFKATSHTLAYFDDQISKILAQGAAPLFVMYIKPGTAFLKADGTTGGTIESNIVYLVNHYKAAPYNLSVQYWEIHNEPEYTVDYQMTPAAYTAAFNSIHNALVAAGVRGNVILCGPASANDYGWGGGVGGSYDLMNTFMDNCKNSVDVITRHIYIDDTDDLLLNNIDRIERQWNVQASAIAHGEALLQQTMDAKGVPSTVMTGVTEFNNGNSSGPHAGGHSLVAGLWHLIALKYCVYNPRSALTASFLYDSYGAGVGGYGCYDASKVRDYNWWALYIHGNRRGWTALDETSTNSKLVVCATRDADYLYVEVINRDVTYAINDTVTITGAPIGQASVFKLSATQNTLLTGESSTYGSSFAYTFPSKSVTIFRYPITPTVGFETAEGYAIGQSITGPAKWSGSSSLFLVDAVGNNTAQGALSSTKTTYTSAYANVSRGAVAADFGGDTAPITAGYTGYVSGSFDIAITEPAATQDDTKAWFMRFGDAGEFELFLRANGLLEIRSTAGSVIAKTATGANFVLGGDYKTIRYIMNFATQTTQVWVDGVAQVTAANDPSIPWQATPANAKFSYVRLQNNVETTNARYNRIKVDNITYAKYAPDPIAGFETSQGYIAGQSITANAQWSGTATLFLVDAVGNNTAQGALSSTKTTYTSAYANVSRGAVAADFGGDTAPITAGYTGYVSGSFDIAITEPAATQDDTKAWFMRFGDAGEFELFLRANGLLEIRSTAGSVIAKTATGTNFVLGGDYKTIRYIMNFATQTTQVWVDGVAQVTAANDASIPWQATPANAKFSYVRLQNNVETTNARYNRIKLDNIIYSK